jgi:hypothetical protein
VRRYQNLDPSPSGCLLPDNQAMREGNYTDHLRRPSAPTNLA